MWRRFLTVALVTLAIASLTQHAQAKVRCCRKVADYLFGGYCGGPFGYGNFQYAGTMTYPNGCVVHAGAGTRVYSEYSTTEYPVSSDESTPSTIATTVKSTGARR